MMQRIRTLPRALLAHSPLPSPPSRCRCCSRSTHVATDGDAGVARPARPGNGARPLRHVRRSTQHRESAMLCIKELPVPAARRVAAAERNGVGSRVSQHAVCDCTNCTYLQGLAVCRL